MIISLSVSALIGIIVFLFGNFGSTEIRLLLTTLSIGGYSLTGMCCSILYERKLFPSFSIVGTGISIIGFIYTILTIWEIIALDEVWKGLLIFIILSWSSAHSSLLLLIESNKTVVKSSLSATLIFIGIVAIMLIVLVLGEISITESFYRWLGVCAILDVLGTIATPILNRIVYLNS